MSFLRCKDAIINIGEVSAVQKWSQADGPIAKHCICFVLKCGETVSVDFSRDDEACGPEPRDRAFEDIWLALKGKAW